MREYKVKKMLFVVPGYPTKEDPSYAFIRPIVCACADEGIESVVFAPQSLSKNIISKKDRKPCEWMDYTDEGNEIRVYQPMYFSVSNLRCFGIYMSSHFREKVLRKLFLKLGYEPDVVYAHFWDMGVCAANIVEKDIPVIVASGESKIRVFERYQEKIIQRTLQQIKGVVAVSTKNIEESRELGLLRSNPKTIILPNAIDSHKFFVRDKSDARKRLSLSDEDFIGVFVGAFIERKGIKRVLSALETNPDVKIMLIGSGETIPKSPQIVFQGRVSHEKLSHYLNAADFFVLPTLAEGCCNAIVEAMACGLPIISSDLSFNYDVLDTKNAILVNPLNIDEISEAINTLKQNKDLCKEMSAESLNKAKSLEIKERIHKLLNFVENVVS